MSDQEIPNEKYQNKLILACKKNDRTAQFELYKMYSNAMYTICVNIINDRTQAEDLMQDAFISAFTKINSFKGEVSFGAWLKKITINRCIDELKKKKIQFENIDNYENIPDEINSTEADGFVGHSVKLIKDTILTLPAGYRTILSLYLFEGYDHQEIAEILKISASTSRSQYTRAKTLLVKKLKNKR